MGFLDKARAAATDLAGRAETMINDASTGLSGQGTSGVYAELGRLVYAEHQGQAADPARRAELIAQIEATEARAATTPPPPGSTPGAPPPGPSSSPPPPGPSSSQPPPGPSTAPPPPPPPTA